MPKLPSLTTVLHRLLAVGILALILVFTPAAAIADHSADHSTQEPDVEISDIPNLEQIDRDSFEQHIGDVPKAGKPILLNPDNGKESRIEDKTPGSEKTITPEDLKKN